MSDQGIAVAPGLRTLIGLAYTNVSIWHDYFAVQHWVGWSVACHTPLSECLFWHFHRHPVRVDRYTENKSLNTWKIVKRRQNVESVGTKTPKHSMPITPDVRRLRIILLYLHFCLHLSYIYQCVRFIMLHLPSALAKWIRLSISCKTNSFILSYVHIVEFAACYRALTLPFKLSQSHTFI